MLSMSMTSLKVRAALEGTAFSGEQAAVVLPLEPSLYSDKSELMLSNLHPSAELTIYGPTAALSSLEVAPFFAISLFCHFNYLFAHD